MLKVSVVVSRLHGICGHRAPTNTVCRGAGGIVFFLFVLSEYLGKYAIQFPLALHLAGIVRLLDRCMSSECL